MLIPCTECMYFNEIWPFKPCTLPKHVRVEILRREFPVKTCTFPVRDCSAIIFGKYSKIPTIVDILRYSTSKKRCQADFAWNLARIIEEKHVYYYWATSLKAHSASSTVTLFLRELQYQGYRNGIILLIMDTKIVSCIFSKGPLKS